MKDYSRKHYTDYQYKDWMRATPSKSVWNSILSQNTGYGEFSVNKNRKSSLASSISLYLKQSERKKPYIKGEFLAMEEDWEGPVGGFTPPGDTKTPPFDQPWNLVNNSGGGPWSVIFDLEVEGCWCDNETRNFTASGTHPIQSLSISSHNTGTYITIGGGLGTPNVTGSITTVDESGNVNFTASMRSADGVPGSSNDFIYECRDCDPCEITPLMTAGSNPETISPSSTEGLLVVDGVGPYSWTVSGTDYTLTYATTDNGVNGLIAGSNACGSATVTVTDDCETVVTIFVRSTSVDSGWVFKGYTCTMPGAPTEGDGRTRIVGNKRQIQYWHEYATSGYPPTKYGECDSHYGPAYG